MDNKGKKGKKDQVPDFLSKAEQIIKNAIDEQNRQGIFELCKYQFEVYKGFISLECRPDEALRQTIAHIEAIMRSGKKDQEDK